MQRRPGFPQQSADVPVNEVWPQQFPGASAHGPPFHPPANIQPAFIPWPPGQQTAGFSGLSKGAIFQAPSFDRGLHNGTSFISPAAPTCDSGLPNRSGPEPFLSQQNPDFQPPPYRMPEQNMTARRPQFPPGGRPIAPFPSSAPGMSIRAYGTSQQLVPTTFLQRPAQMLIHSAPSWRPETHGHLMPGHMPGLPPNNTRGAETKEEALLWKDQRKGFQPPPVKQRSANFEPAKVAPIADGSLHSSHPASQQHSTYTNGAGHSAASQPTVQKATHNQNRDKPPISQYLEKESAQNKSLKRPANEQGGGLQDGKRHRGEAPRVPGWKSKAGEAVDVSDQFALEDVNKDAFKKKVERETDPHRLAQRQKQIDFGKNTLGYERFLEVIPRSNRQKGDPQTPTIHQVCSKRSWDGQIKKWRRLLHQYDPPADEEAEFADEEFVPGYKGNVNRVEEDEAGSENGLEAGLGDDKPREAEKSIFEDDEDEFVGL